MPEPPGAPACPCSVSVIVAARPDDADIAALRYLEEWRPRGVIEILVARGWSPAAQRNAAAREASGDLLLFLDDDCKPDVDLIERHLDAFRNEPVAAAVGGPAIYRARGFSERLIAAVLSEPVVTGRSASRYRACGRRRRSDERELILSNLAVRRAVFEAAGGFDEGLYPNEENAFLQRLQALDECVLYDPQAVVTRPAPGTTGEFLRKVFGYGRGRAAQARRGVSRVSALRIGVPLAALFAVATVFAVLPWELWPIVSAAILFSGYLALVAWRVSCRESVAVCALAPVVAVATHLAYGWGILAGLIGRLPSMGSVESIERWSLPPVNRDAGLEQVER